MLQSRSKLHTRDNGKRDRERDGDRCSVLVGDDILQVHKTIVPEEQLHILLHWSLVAMPSQAPPTNAINSDSPELKQTMSCFLEDAYTGYQVFSAEPLTHTAMPE